MSEHKTYDVGELAEKSLTCGKCGEEMKPGPVTLSYLGHAFPVELPCCLRCGQIYIPEELATGKILHVERSLEDK